MPMSLFSLTFILLASGSFSKQVVICSNTRQRLSCTAEEIIWIDSAKFGRITKANTCKNGTLNCPAVYDVSNAVQITCDCKVSCVLSAKNSRFGNRCLFFTSHLDVSYRCLTGVIRLSYCNLPPISTPVQSTTPVITNGATSQAMRTVTEPPTLSTTASVPTSATRKVVGTSTVASITATTVPATKIRQTSALMQQTDTRPVRTTALFTITEVLPTAHVTIAKTLLPSTYPIQFTKATTTSLNTAEPHPESAVKSYAIWAGVGVVLVILVVAIILLVRHYKSKNSHATNPLHCCSNTVVDQPNDGKGEIFNVLYDAGAHSNYVYAEAAGGNEVNPKQQSSEKEVVINPAYEFHDDNEVAYVYSETKVNELYAPRG